MGDMGEQDAENRNKGSRILLIVLPLIVLACLSLWYVRHYYRIADMTRVKSRNGVFDLTETDFDTGFVRLEGEVAYIPGILTPAEFAARENEARGGSPSHIPSATSRIRILVPDDGIYMVTGASVDFAHRVYVGGELRFEAGVPAETAAGFVRR